MTLSQLVLTAIAEQIVNNPATAALLAAALGLITRLAKGAGPREILTREALRRTAFRVAHPVFKRLGRPLVHAVKRPPHDDDYVMRVSGGKLSPIRKLLDAGAQWNPTAAVKYRSGGVGRTKYEFASLAFQDDGKEGDQTHVYLFHNDDGTVDVYAHHEAKPTDVDDHHGATEVTPGDPTGIVRETLEDGVV